MQNSILNSTGTVNPVTGVLDESEQTGDFLSNKRVITTNIYLFQCSRNGDSSQLDVENLQKSKTAGIDLKLPVESGQIR